MATEAAAAAATTTGMSEQQVDAMFAEAMAKKRDKKSDPAAAVGLFKTVLAARVARYGETALECASAYMQYGMALFEDAQANADVFGDDVRQAAEERAQQVVAQEEGQQQQQQQQEEEEEEEEEDIEDEQDDAAEPDAAAAAAAAASGEPSAEPAPAAGPAPSPAAAADRPAADDDGDADNASDMQLAWENLEVARVIYEREGGAAQHADAIADIHNFTGDIFCEQGKFEEAVEEYKKCAGTLAAAAEGEEEEEDARRAAEVHFKLALALQYADRTQEALEAARTARSKLQGHLDDLQRRMRAAGGGDGDGDARPASKAEAGAAALAAAMAGYLVPSPPPAAAAAAAGPGSEAARLEDRDELRRLREEAADIRAVLVDLNDKVEELQGVVDSDTSMKDTLRKAFLAMASAEQGPGGGSGGGGSSSGAAVQDLGVVGRGKRVAPLPAAAAGAGDPPAAAAAEGGAAAAGKPKRSLDALMGGPPGAAGGTTSVGFGASRTNVAADPAAPAAPADAAGDAGAAKKVRVGGDRAPDGAENQQTAKP